MSAAALDSETIASLDDQLKEEKRKNESIKACLLDATKNLDDVCEIITEINKKLLTLENMDVTAATTVNCGATTVARDIDIDIDMDIESSESPAQNIPRKRARIK